MVDLVLDSSSLISLSTSCLFEILNGLQKQVDLEFIVPQSVVIESVDRPSHIKRFELSAVRIKRGITKKAIQVKKLNAETEQYVKKIVDSANQLFHTEKQFVKILHRGEADALGLLKQLNSSVLVIDEKITRLLIEDMDSLKRLLEKRQGTKMRMSPEHKKILQEILPKPKIIRSAELVSLAYEENLLEDIISNSKHALEAALYSVKYKGCSLTDHEIQEYLKQVK
jgi:predicted nucleic acid-binding protein